MNAGLTSKVTFQQFLNTPCQNIPLSLQGAIIREKPRNIPKYRHMIAKLQLHQYRTQIFNKAQVSMTVSKEKTSRVFCVFQLHLFLTPCI